MADADPEAEMVITGTVLTVDDVRPTAQALAVADGRIIAVGNRSDVNELIGADIATIDVGAGCVMPGFVEAHGHPLMEAAVLSDRIVDVRPVTMRGADDVADAIRREAAQRGPAGAYLSGWDPLLQSGLPEPTPAGLDDIAPGGPLVIVHNSGHEAYFNSPTARHAGLTRDAPDPKGARYGHDADGEPDGTAAAWQLFADDVIGSLEVGKYADMYAAMVVLSADPRTVPPEKIADLEVRATYLAGRRVYRR